MVQAKPCNILIVSMKSPRTFHRRTKRNGNLGSRRIWFCPGAFPLYPSGSGVSIEVAGVGLSRASSGELIAEDPVSHYSEIVRVGSGSASFGAQGAGTEVGAK